MKPSRCVSGAVAVVLGTLAALATSCYRLPSALREPLRANDPMAFGREHDPVPPDAPRVRFAAIGDVGNRDWIQGTIARGVHAACDGQCDFVVLLGDNLYDEGVADETDAERLACIVERYPSDHAYLVLGNHDYRISAPLLSRARNQLRWIREDTAPDGGTEARGGFHFYRLQAGPVDLIGLDTNYLVRSKLRVDYEDLLGWLGRLQHRSGRWTIVMGHHPYASNGAHGNAGAYRDGGLRIWPGRFFQFFMQKHVLGRADLYLAGHDHNLQFFSRLQGMDTAQVVSGAGAKCRVRGDATNVADMERYGYGFAIVEATSEALTVRFHDFRGAPFWAARRTRKAPHWAVIEGPRHLRDTTTHCEDEARQMSPNTARPDPCRR